MTIKVKIIKDKVTGVYTGQLVGLPEVISEGRSMGELKINIIDALRLVLELKAELKKSKKYNNGALAPGKKSSAIYELTI